MKNSGKEVLFINTDENISRVGESSFIRLKDGILFVYTEYISEINDDHGKAQLCGVVSYDEGETWSEFEFCIGEAGYYCAINDGAYVTESGRIYIPMSYHGVTYDIGKGFIKEGNDNKSAVIKIMYSDNCGKEWKLMYCELKSPFDDDCGFGEPGIMKLEDGALWVG